VRKSLNSLSFSVEPMNPTEFAAYVRSETQRWAKMVKEAAIEPE
jgi:tripartite-type tricarboxylate transporter receptor subunit TctC